MTATDWHRFPTENSNVEPCMKPRLRPSRDKTMIDHDTLQQTVPIIGIDLCFSGIQQCHFYPIINNMKIRMRYADLDNADWYWANYGS